MRPFRPPRIDCKRDSLVITRFADEEVIYSFDHAGRLFAVWRRARLYRRALDGRVMEKFTDRSGLRPRRRRRLLDPDERAALIDATAGAAQDALTALRRGEAELLWSMPGLADLDQANSLVESAAQFDAGAADVDARRFAAAYTPVSILPPDRYRALVVQITEGCHWNRCTFCSFYRDRPFRIKTVEEFGAHLDAVAAFFGAGLSLRLGVFLGDANALLLPAGDLAPRLDLLARRLPEHAQDVSAFIDVFTGHRREATGFAALYARGLRRIYLGMESGDDATLAFVNKPQTAAEAVDLVHAAKRAGLHAGVIIMAGIGGRRYARRHVRATLDALAAMRLGRGDLIFISAFAPPAEGPYAERAAAEGVEALKPDEVEDQVDELMTGMRQSAGQGIRVARYDIEEFLY